MRLTSRHGASDRTKVALGPRVLQKAYVSVTAAPNPFVPRRGRPSAKQVAAIERTILTTARRMFLDEGYDAVAMEAVALRAGVSKGTLYARHSTKDALFNAVVEESVADWSASAAVDDHLLTDVLEDRLRHHAHVIARYQFEPDVQAFQRLMTTSKVRFPALSQAMYDKGYSYIVNLIRTDILDAALRDNRPVRDADSIARHLIATIIGWATQESSGREVTCAELLAVGDRTVSLLMAARDMW